MKNNVEGTTGFYTMHSKCDVVRLLKMLKSIAHRLNNRVHLQLQAMGSWKQFVNIRQQDNKELVDYYKRFTSLLELIEWTCSKVVPVEIAKKSDNYSSNQCGVEDDE